MEALKRRHRVPDYPTSRRVLVVDDNVDEANSLCLLLEVLGHAVDCIYEPRLVLERARKFAPDVALLDLTMPELDGYEVCRVLRSALGEGLFIVAVTGHSEQDYRIRARKAGFDAVLIKPFDVKTVEAVFRTLDQAPL